MNTFIYILIIIIMAISFNSFSSSQDMLDPNQISYRPPKVAGSFYPADPDSLKEMIKEYLDLQQPKKVNTEIYGLISPHAGYVFSGSVAGKAYREIIGSDYDLVVIISPSHFKSFKGSSVFDGEAYVTPLGISKVDTEFAKKLTSINEYVFLSNIGHGWKDSSAEHSLEVQIPFLQTVLPDVKIVPIVMGSQDFKGIHTLSMALIKTIISLNKKILLVASSDLSHFYDYNTARKLDISFIKLLSAYDYFSLSSQLYLHKVEACGGGPIATVMIVSEYLGANKLVPLKYANSGDSPAGKTRRDRVVGYLAAALTKDEDYTPSFPTFTDEEKEILLNTARESIKRTVTNTTQEEKIRNYVPRNLGEFLTCFVTIRKNGKLRACMGHTYPRSSLIVEVEEVAKLAATQDYRFGPIQKSELDSLDIEITILSRFYKIFDISEIVIGRDGLLIRYENATGLLLPQVATENNWDTQTFLEHLCRKAGFPEDYYLNPDAELYRFSAVIIK
ncbi:MAG: AmmeMemoRadiSam system protein B [Candidatus Kapabacteria bacterium]|nr:AmmeMemoRadiSam system protein B [Candidatus Kapabacteria bacterium]